MSGNVTENYRPDVGLSTVIIFVISGIAFSAAYLH